MKFNFILVTCLLLLGAQAHASKKIYCGFQQAIQKGSNPDWGYIYEYTVSGTVNPDGSLSINAKRTEYGTSNINGVIKIDLAKKRQTLIDFQTRKFVVASKSANEEWTTYVPKNEYSDGNIANISITISNKNLTSTDLYQASYKAIYKFTLLGDDSNAVEKDFGTCTYSN